MFQPFCGEIKNPGNSCFTDSVDFLSPPCFVSFAHVISRVVVSEFPPDVYQCTHAHIPNVKPRKFKTVINPTREQPVTTFTCPASELMFSVAASLAGMHRQMCHREINCRWDTSAKWLSVTSKDIDWLEFQVRKQVRRQIKKILLQRPLFTYWVGRVLQQPRKYCIAAL